MLLVLKSITQLLKAVSLRFAISSVGGKGAGDTPIVESYASCIKGY
jgi:hypothetical protein